MAIEQAKDLVILILGLAGGHITTDTRFQKIAFLVNEEVLKKDVKFEPMDFGPYSKELVKAVNELKKEGKVNYVLDNDGVSHYFLTKEGEKEFNEQLKKRIGQDKLEKAKKIVEKFKDVPLTYLLAYVYANYLEYTVKSKITDKVEEWRKYYGI
ncbi:transcriptional regulator [Saccharolobus islandicus]|uniref:Uncharacterized protein n=2 Tax=Saccharolobus islandicus TaxID=43080 RepID=C4KI13_SACI6|nr:transcriptional regulator [Sulfolobus islandicus]ACP55428.1 conserved hypothetical protein [Sulfolobus islandicus M.16.27]ACR42227.1 conserved hypothetical protein [Sulfolobus islandicus M.16.4]